jgi:hypothetical protein
MTKIAMNFGSIHTVIRYYDQASNSVDCFDDAIPTVAKASHARCERCEAWCKTGEWREESDARFAIF